MTISGLVLVAINISGKSCRENTDTYVEHVFWKPCRGKSVTAGQDTDDNMARARITCWITKFTNTHSSSVKLTVLPLQQRLHERAPVLRYTYSTLLVLLQLKRHRVSVGGGGNVSVTKFQFLRKYVKQYFASWCQLRYVTHKSWHDQKALKWFQVTNKSCDTQHFMYS